MTTPTSILVATDFGPCSERAFADAFELARRLDVRVSVVHAFSLPGLPEEGAMVSRAIDDAQREAEGRMREFLKSHDTTGHLGEVIVRMGDPAQTIMMVAEQVGAELIVVGTHGRRGLSRLLLGSVAETVVRNAHCPVMVIRSPGSEAAPTARAS